MVVVQHQRLWKFIALSQLGNRTDSVFFPVASGHNPLRKPVNLYRPTVSICPQLSRRGCTAVNINQIRTTRAQHVFNELSHRRLVSRTYRVDVVGQALTTQH